MVLPLSRSEDASRRSYFFFPALFVLATSDASGKVYLYIDIISINIIQHYCTKPVTKVELAGMMYIVHALAPFRCAAQAPVKCQ